MKRLHLLLIALLACGLLVAGCGGDDDDDTSDEPAATQTAPADTTADEATEPAPEAEPEPDGGAGADDVPQLDAATRERAVEACKQSVQAAAQLSEDVKSDLEEICEQAAEGDEEAVREASVDVCKRIVEDSVPSGPAREQALQSCEQAGR